MAASSAYSAISSPSTHPLITARSSSHSGTSSSISFFSANNLLGAHLREYPSKKEKKDAGKSIKSRTAAVATSAAVTTPASEELKEYALPTWAEFDLGKAPVYWKTMNGLPPTSGEKLTLFYNPAAKGMAPNEEFGIGFNGGFNQPIMCGGEPRVMLRKNRGKADLPFYTIRICVPKHAVTLIFSFTNGVEWDGPYHLRFQVPKAWKNKPISFFNEGLVEELSKEGACDRAIFPDSSIVTTRCSMIGNLSIEGGDRCNLDFVLGCMDPSSPSFNPLANVDDGSCPPYSDSE
ncbi:hypothetical protein Syun_025767 [Stephania yunnanensis]|uniref:PIFI-like Ig-like domain-containing protein n=1 Tax=Stephania yunnanensis TaxID=152371 RepID=A0AAP0EV71_9MAGN